MDANQTRFQLVLGRDWLAARDDAGRPPDSAADIAIERDALVLRRRVPVLQAVPSDRPADPALRRGAARDRAGNIYLVTGEGILLRRCPGRSDEPEAWFWRHPGVDLHGLAITRDDVLVAGRWPDPQHEHGALLLFDLQAGGPPRELPLDFLPHDLAAHGSAVAILDRNGARIHHLTITAPTTPIDPDPPAPAPADFHPCSPPPVPAWQLELRLDHTLPADTDILALDLLGPGDLVLLTPTDLLRRHPDGKVTALALAELAEPPPGAPPPSPTSAPRGHDLAVHAGRLAVVEAQGNQAFFFDLVADALVHRAEFVPLRGYLGHDLVGGDGHLWYAAGPRWVPLVALPRPLYPASARVRLPIGAREGWDSRLPGCVWHRLLLDACIPAGAGVRVWSRAADELAAFTDPDLGWHPEPALLRRPDGPELPFVRNPPGVATWELLLQRAVGRHLQLRLELSGDRRFTPRLIALRVYHPRFSYLDHYLPAAWREDPGSADFVARFLANPEGLFTALEDRVANVHRLLDPADVDPEWLPWLAGWFDATLDDAWTEAQRRSFIRHAPALFAWRGTLRGLRAAVRLALHPTPAADPFTDSPGGPEILEHYLQRPGIGRLPATLLARTDDPTVRWDPAFGGDALHRRWHAFLARLDPPILTDTPFPPHLSPLYPSPWRAFCRAQLHFEPGATGTHAASFARLVQQRHGQAVTTVWAVLPTAAADAPLFPALPQDGPRLSDWFALETLALPLARHAHRFTVVLPTPTRERLAAEPDLLARLRVLVRRVVEAEKPAHTVFDVVFAEHHFRPGEVHLGTDTLLGAPDRSDAPPLHLGRDALGEAVTPAPFPALPPESP